MSILMKTYQFVNEKNVKANGKWYGRPIVIGETTIEELAEMMQENCTVKRADILAVLSELGPTMKQALQSGQRVRIPYLGLFRVSFSTEGQEKEEDVTERSVKRLRLLFRPELARRSTGESRRQYSMLQGCQVVSAARYWATTDAQNSSSNTGSNSGSGSGSGGGSDSGSGGGSESGGTLNPD